MEKLILNILIRALKVGAVYDDSINHDIFSLPDSYVIKINLKPKNISVSFKVEDNNIIKINEKIEDVKPNLLIEFKDQVTAKKVLFGKISIAQAFCEHRIKVYGNINCAMILTRVINKLECYLFPKFITNKLFNPLPKLEINKVRFYLILLFGGKL